MKRDAARGDAPRGNAPRGKIFQSSFSLPNYYVSLNDTQVLPKSSDNYLVGSSTSKHRNKLLLKKEVDNGNSDSVASDLLLTELVSLSYRIIRWVLPWQGMNCPSAYEDVEGFRHKLFTALCDSLVCGFRCEENHLFKQFREGILSHIKLCEEDEFVRVNAVMTNSIAIHDMIVEIDNKRRLECYEIQKGMHNKRMSDHVSCIDGLDSQNHLKCLEFVYGNTGGSVTSVDKRGINYLAYVSNRKSIVNSVTKLQSVYEKRDDCYTWLSALGDSVRFRDFVVKETKRVADDVREQEVITTRLREAEDERIDDVFGKERNRVVDDYDRVLVHVTQLSDVNLALSKGFSEAVSRCIRGYVNSNDSSAEKLNLFWEIKNSVNRFNGRRRAWDGRVAGDCDALMTWNSKCVKSGKKFEAFVRSERDARWVKECERVKQMNDDNNDAFQKWIREVEYNNELYYTKFTQDVVQTRYRHTQRNEMYDTEVLRFRENEYKEAGRVWESTGEKYKNVQRCNDVFKNECYDIYFNQDTRNNEYYDVLEIDLKHQVEHLERMCVATLMTHQNVIDVQQEIIHDKLFKEFKDTHESDVFPMPIADMFTNTGKKIKEEVIKYCESVEEEKKRNVEEKEIEEKLFEEKLREKDAERQRILEELVATKASQDAASTPPENCEWTLYYDEENEHSYYYNDKTSESVWESEASQELLDSITEHAKQVEASEAANVAAGETQVKIDALRAEVYSTPVKPKRDPEAVGVTAAPATPFASPLPSLPEIQSTQRVVVERIDDFFHNRLQTIEHEAAKFRAEFTNTADYEKEKLSQMQEELNARCAQLYANLQQQQREFARDVKDHIASFSTSQRSVIGARADDSLIHETISFWNKREIEFKMLVDKILDESTVPEATAINIALSSTIKSAEALSQRERQIPAPDEGEKIAQRALSEGYAETFLEACTEASSKLVISLEELLRIPVVSSLPPHVLSAALGFAEADPPVASHGSRTSSASLATMQLPFFNVKAFSDAVGRVQSSIATTKSVTTAFQAALSPEGAKAYSDFQTRIARCIETEVETLAAIATSAISAECSSEDDSSISPVSFYQTLKFASPSATLSSGDVHYLLFHFLSTDALPTTALLKSLWTEPILNAAHLSFVTSGQVSTPSNLNPETDDSPSPYMVHFLREAFREQLEQNAILSPDLPTTSISADQVATVLETSAPFLLPKPIALAVISNAAYAATRIVPESHRIPPSFSFEVADDAVVCAFVHSVCSILSVAFQENLPALNQRQADELTKTCEKNKLLDTRLEDFEGQGDTPLRVKHVKHSRRVMDANILHDLVALGENWAVSELYAEYDKISSNDDPNKALTHANSVALIALGHIVVSPNEFEIRLVNQNSRHLGWNNRVFVEFRALSAAAPLAVTSILRRYDSAFFRLRKSRFNKEVAPLNESAGDLSLVDMITRRLNREYNRNIITRELAEDETFHTLNHLRCTLLKISNDFEQNRIKNYIKDNTALTAHQGACTEALAEKFTSQEASLTEFVNATLEKLQTNTQTEISLVKEFRTSAQHAVEGFNEEIKGLLQETEDIFLKSIDFHKKLAEDVVSNYENHSCRRSTESLQMSISSFIHDSLETLKAESAENSAQHSVQEMNLKEEYEAGVKKLTYALTNANKEVFDKAALLLIEVNEATEEKLKKCDEELEEARIQQHKIMADAEKEVAAKAAEEVAAATAAGNEDKFSVVQANLNADATRTIMEAAKEKAAALFDAATDKMNAVEEEIKTLADNLPARIDLIVQSLDEKIDSLRLEEKARCDKTASAVISALMAFIEKQEQTVRNARQSTLKGISEMYKEGMLVAENEENAMVSLIEKKVTENFVQESAMFAECKKRMLRWADETKKVSSADSERIFESTLSRSDNASDDEMKFLVTCHDALTSLASERVGLLRRDYNIQVDQQVDEALTFSSEQTVEMITASTERSVGLLLEGLVQQVEVLSSSESTFAELQEKERIEDGIMKVKEEKMLEDFTEKSATAFTANEKKKTREIERATVELQSVCSSLVKEARQRSDESSRMSKSASAMMAEMEKNATEKRAKMFQGLAAKRAAETAKLLKEGHSLLAPIDLITWSANTGIAMEKITGRVNPNDVMVFTMSGKDFTNENFEVLANDFSGPTKNFFAVLYGFDQVNEKLVELGRTEIVIDTLNPVFEKMLLVKKDSHDRSRLSVRLFSADLQSNSENVDDHKKLGEAHFTYDQLVQEKKGIMSFTLSGSGSLQLTTRTATGKDFNQKLEKDFVLGHTRDLVVKVDKEAVRVAAAKTVATAFVWEVLGSKVQNQKSWVLESLLFDAAASVPEEKPAEGKATAEGAPTRERAHTVNHGSAEDAVKAAQAKDLENEDEKAKAVQRLRAHTVNHGSVEEAIKAAEEKELEAENEKAMMMTRQRAHTINHRSAEDAVKANEEDELEAENEKAMEAARIRSHTVEHRSAADAVAANDERELEEAADIAEGAQRSRAHTVNHGSAADAVAALNEQAEADEKARAQRARATRTRKHTVGHSLANDAVVAQGDADSMDGSLSFVSEDDATVHLELKEFDGTEYLVDMDKNKVYTHDDDQLFLGKLTDGGLIDTSAVDSSDEEEESTTRDDEVAAAAAAQKRSRSHTIGHRAAAAALEQAGDQPSVGSFDSAPPLEVTQIDGVEYLLERHSGKVYTHDHNQHFLGKLGKDGKIDTSALDSSDEEDDGSIVTNPLAPINVADEGSSTLGTGVSLLESSVEGDEVATAAAAAAGGAGSSVSLVPPSGQPEVRGSMAGGDEESSDEEDTHLHVQEIDGVKYLVDMTSKKVYDTSANQNFVGNLFKGVIDKSAVDSSDEESDGEEFTHGPAK
jgi:hypothetical protein